MSTQLLSNSEPQAGLIEALSQMTSALQILDEQNAPGDIGAHLDLAIQRLTAALEQAHRMHMTVVSS